MKENKSKMQSISQECNSRQDAGCIDNDEEMAVRKRSQSKEGQVAAQDMPTTRRRLK